jgi:hypothetical protein
LVGNGHQHHLLFLNDSEPVLMKALPRRIELRREHVDDAVHLRVAVDVDAGGADASDRGGEHARAIGCERHRQIRSEMCHRPPHGIFEALYAARSIISCSVNCVAIGFINSTVFPDRAPLCTSYSWRRM